MPEQVDPVLRVLGEQLNEQRQLVFVLGFFEYVLPAGGKLRFAFRMLPLQLLLDALRLPAKPAANIRSIGQP